MKIRNPQGRIVSVNQDFYSRYITKRGWDPVDSISSENTKNEIMEYLDSKGVEYSQQMRKAELLELV